MDWKSGGDTNFAPIASADGELDCRGFWDKGKTDKDALWTSNAEVVPSVRRYVDVDRRQLRAGAGDQARAAVARRGDPLDPPRRQQPLQPRRRGLGRAVVAGADRQPRQLHAADGQRPRRPARPGRPRCACRCTAAPASSSTPSACGTSSCIPATAARYALITSFESGPGARRLDRRRAGAGLRVVGGYRGRSSAAAVGDREVGDLAHDPGEVEVLRACRRRRRRRPRAAAGPPRG